MLCVRVSLNCWCEPQLLTSLLTSDVVVVVVIVPVLVGGYNIGGPLDLNLDPYLLYLAQGFINPGTCRILQVSNCRGHWVWWMEGLP